jgi:hypothetical protein
MGSAEGIAADPPARMRSEEEAHFALMLRACVWADLEMHARVGASSHVLRATEEAAHQQVVRLPHRAQASGLVNCRDGLVSSGRGTDG